ncbi:MAG: glycosyltransferase family 2 protein [Nodosilinea sp.]
MKTSQFKVHSICLVKNEIDIVEYCLKQASTWCDHIYVLDNGSTDGTWEKVQSLESDRVTVWKQDLRPYDEALCSDVYHAFKDRAKPGDWWCRLDADEIYDIQHPKEFLAKVDKRYYTVHGTGIEYWLSQQDVDKIDFTLPLESLLPKLSLYRATWYEPRFVRHRDGMQWTGAWPRHLGLMYPEPVLYRHYKFRTPEQIQKRLDVRLESFLRGGSLVRSPREEFDASWKSKLVDPKDMQVDDGSGQYVVGANVRLDPPHKRLVKFAMHRTGLWV